MSRFRHHVFVCLNERTADDPRGCCLAKGSAEVLDRLKEGIHRRGLRKEIRVNKAGCLDQCAKGVSIVVYPEGVWYGRVTVEDVDEIIERHLIGGEPVGRLLTESRTQDPELRTKTQGGKREPESRTQDPEPRTKTQGGKREPESRTQDPEPRTKAQGGKQEPESRTQDPELRTKTQGGKQEPESRTQDPELRTKTQRGEREPEPESRIQDPGPRTKTQRGDPERRAKTEMGELEGGAQDTDRGDERRAGTFKSRPTAKTFRDLIVWRKSHQLVLEVYRITQAFPPEERYGISAQMRRAASSISANIAEAFKKWTGLEKARILNIAQSSLEELRYFLILAGDLGYTVVSKPLTQLEEVSKILDSYTATIRRSAL